MQTELPAADGGNGAPAPPFGLPTRIIEDGGLRTEETDIPIVHPTWDRPSHKVVRRDAIAGHTDRERGTLLSICYTLFVEHWDRVVFGPCIEGAVFELKLSEPPSFSFLDGYLTVSLPPGPSHLHLCLGETRGLGQNRTPPALAKKRQCSAAVFARSIGGGCSPESYSLRLMNGAGEQMITFFLPSPFLGDDMKRLARPDWSRLSLWNDLRARVLGEQALGEAPR
ncbi:MAG TPA: hypothetical protein VHC69_34830 [Polyangiaceae bacterium]|nr:hypothetical protein [Polyangiaceae bacterium]